MTLFLRGLGPDAISRIARPLPRRDGKLRGYLRLVALDFWIAYGARVALRAGFWERAWKPLDPDSRRVRNMMRASPVWPVPVQSRFVRVVLPGGEEARLASWDTSGRLMGKARNAVRDARVEYLRRGVLHEARLRLREEVGSLEILDGDEAALAAETLGPESMGAFAIAATARAGVFDDIHDGFRT